MVSAPLLSSRVVTLLSVVSQHVPNLARKLGGPNDDPTILHTYARRAAEDPHSVEFIVFACLIPVLVLLSGVFAGLTLGYMSLDETQLNVLSISGTPQQKSYAAKIKPIRQNGHLLLVTLLLANMIVNETLPIISDPVLGGGVQSVIVSTILIVIFSEIIPQSLCTRHGLYLGAKMAGFTRVLIYLMGVVAWPVAKLLEFALGPHHGIIYRRAELKELIAMHSSLSAHGGDLNTDTVNIIGATLDLQEKVVKQAMTPIDNVFMLSIDSKLDYDTMQKVCMTGHSRVPVYEEVEVAVDPSGRLEKVKKIIGILLVKHCVMLDPKDAIPLRKIPLNKVPFVPNNESLLHILDRFQEGRSHIAIVSRFSVEKAASVKKVAKRTLTQRLRQSVGISDSSSDSSDYSDDEFDPRPEDSAKNRAEPLTKGVSWADESTTESTIRGNTADEKEIQGTPVSVKNTKRGRHRQHRKADLESGLVDSTNARDETKDKQTIRLQKPGTALEQNMPADALLTKKDAKDFLQGIDPAIMPLGIITLEDVLEELIGEEIYDEFDVKGANETKSSFVPSEHAVTEQFNTSFGVPPQIKDDSALRTLNTRGLAFLRSKSAPPSPRDRGRALPLSSTPSQATRPSTPMRARDINTAPPSAVASPRPTVVTIADEPKVKGEMINVLTSENTTSDPVMPRAIPMRRRPISTSDTASSAVSPANPVSARSASPAPFEAILLDRKRRLAAATAAGKDVGPMMTSSVSGSSEDYDAKMPTNLMTRPITMPPKSGKSFKSSPLGGGRQTGVVIAEKAKQDIKEHVRIPGETDKARPDKEDGSGM